MSYKKAIERNGKPEIINSAQGALYCAVSTAFVDNGEIQACIDDKGRVTDNIFIERFWHTLK